VPSVCHFHGEEIVTERPLSLPHPIAALLGEVPLEARALVVQALHERTWELVATVIALPDHVLSDIVAIHAEGTLPQRAHALARLEALVAAFSRQGDTDAGQREIVAQEREAGPLRGHGDGASSAGE
jgi:hypothetical protein